MAFEKYFRRKYNRPGNESFISIMKNGVIGFSKQCIKEFLQDYDNILLLYDEEKNRIGFKPQKEQDDLTYSFAARATVMKTISGLSFLKYFNIDFSKTQRFKPHWNDHEELIEIDLNKPMRRNI